MQTKLKLAVLALCCSPMTFAQTPQNNATMQEQADKPVDESAFTFTEAQLDEDENMSQNVTIVGSNNNAYASRIGFLFSPMRFRYRALNQRYNEVYVNGTPMNDMENGQFSFSAVVGGLNHQTRGYETSLPFEDNTFAMSGLAGSQNYNFRPAAMSTGHRLTLSAANRSYVARGIYSYNSGLNAKGWAFSAGVGYRWAKEGYVEGTFYNSLSYFLGVQKVTRDGHHSIALTTWGSPTERGQQIASTDEMYWIANDRQYNANWGWQDGKKRNSRVVTNFTPSAILTWDWNIDNTTKLTTSLFGQYGMDKRTRVNYNNSDNPRPDYYKLMPSNFYDVWGGTERYQTAQNREDWNTAYEYLSSEKAHRQIDWNRLYEANRVAASQGADAMYYLQARRLDHLRLSLASTLNKQLGKNKTMHLGIVGATNRARHYQTMEDLLGATSFHNVNNYAIGRYAQTDNRVQYDMNNPDKAVEEGDVFGYDYKILVNKAHLWSSYVENIGSLHYMLSGRLGYTDMQRDGKMRNGMAPDNSYGKGDKAKFVDGGMKFGSSLNLGGGNTITLGIGYEHRAPQSRDAFVAPEVNNDFVSELKNEHVFSSEIGYMLQTTRLHANINAYYSRMTHISEWQNFYDDDANSFTYVSMNGIKKHYYGIEAGVKVKVFDFLDAKLIGTLSEAKNINNANVWYMSSQTGTFNDNVPNHEIETVYNKGMHEAGTPLTAVSLGLSFHKNGWFIDLNCNYYDRIYLSYSPAYRYAETLKNRQEVFGDVYDVDGEIRHDAVAQTKGKGGFMLDGSIGKSLYLRHGHRLSINLMVTNILNNEKLCTGGYEQSRSSYSATSLNERTYKFDRNPMKFYAFGTNGMLNVTYNF